MQRVGWNYLYNITASLMYVEEKFVLTFPTAIHPPHALIPQGLNCICYGGKDCTHELFLY